MLIQRLTSRIDDTVNHVFDDGSEFRRVQREGYDTVYLSSHTGCAVGCRMCWLTATNQTRMRALGAETIIERAASLVRPGVPTNYAFMARGEALLNFNVDEALVRRLLRLNPARCKVSISTVLPDLGTPAEVMLNRFGSHPPVLYWSVYSLDSEVRREWLPKAMNPITAAQALVRWQQDTHMEVVVHHALIKGVNDREADAVNIITLLRNLELNYRVNLVRFNPPPGSDYQEASGAAYEAHRRLYIGAVGARRVRAKPRVGPDVYASCGQFVEAL